jgi:phosphatidate cytidylyltransferase
MLRLRIITAAIGLPILVAAVWFGTPWFTMLIAAMAAIGSLEFYKLGSQLGLQPLAPFGVLWTILIIASQHSSSNVPEQLLVTSGIIIPAIYFLARRNRERALTGWVFTIAGIMYIGWMMRWWVGLRNLDHGMEWVFFGLLATFINDTCAFFCGRAWGTRPLAPSISPSKTWQGAIGGGIATVLIAVPLKVVLHLPITHLEAIFLGSLLSLFAQLGDLLESMLKRNAGVKDSGSLLPGHGGMLDRIDSLIFTGVIVYYWALFTS